MSHFKKVFIISFSIFLSISAIIIINSYKKIQYNNEQIPSYGENWLEGYDIQGHKISIKDYKAAIIKSSRVNFLIAGLEWPRTDTLIFASYDLKAKKADMISIPRDTYYYKEGFRSGFSNISEYKINAIYGDEDIDGVKKAVEDIMGLPVHNYIVLTYQGVENIIDSVGGVEMDIPFDMYYKDVWDDPPLLIDIKKGTQLLDGEKSVKFLRFRQNSDHSISYGDIQRIELQQEFIKNFIKKALSYKIVLVINEVFNSIDTDAKLGDILNYGKSSVGIELSDISFYKLPGSAEYIGTGSFWIRDEEEIRKLVYEIYDIKTLEDKE